LDELPQLWNILRGDMNFIGPRPEVPEFIDPANPLHRRVYAVRPGLIDSGTLRWLDEAEVLARASDWKAYYREVILPDKLQCSLEDIEAKSLWRDCRLFVGGLGKIASRVAPRHS
jgi:lipopolysaccharide/colanic/teichoic acid biosynthesis glycosyltransferase